MTLLVGRPTNSSGRGDFAKASRASYSLSSSAAAAGTDESLPPTLRLNFVIIFQRGGAAEMEVETERMDGRQEGISPATMNAKRDEKSIFNFRVLSKSVDSINFLQFCVYFANARNLCENFVEPFCELLCKYVDGETISLGICNCTNGQ